MYDEKNLPDQIFLLWPFYLLLNILKRRSPFTKKKEMFLKSSCIYLFLDSILFVAGGGKCIDWEFLNLNSDFSAGNFFFG